MKQMIIDGESLKLQNYFLEDIVSQYKKVLNEMSDKKQNKNDLILKMVSKENYILKNSYDSLNATMRLLKINVFLNLIIHFFIFLVSRIA